MKYLNIFEKLINSIINIFVTIIISIPILYFIDSGLSKRLILILIFFCLKLTALFRKDNKTIGMILTKTKWKKKYPKYKHFLHSVFHTISFSTIMFHIWFPLDIFLVNILLIQLPTMLIKKMTFHEFISGKLLQIKSS